MTTETENFTMYLGPQVEQWQSAVQSLNKVHSDVLPQCLIKGRQEEWIGVHPDFPNMDLDFKLLEKAAQGIKFIKGAIGNKTIAADEKGSRDEKSSMDIYHSCEEYFHVMELRFKAKKQCDAVIEASKGLVNNENQILFLQAEHAYAEPEEKIKIAKTLLTQYKTWDGLRNNYITQLMKFVSSCEDLKLYEKESKHHYLNAEVLKTTTLSVIEEMIRETDKLWADAHKYLRDSKEKPENKTKENEDKLLIKESASKKEKKLNYLRTMHKEAEAAIEQASQRELENYLKEISSLNNEMKFEEVTPETTELLSKVKIFITTLGNKIDEKIKENNERKERSRIELNANIKSMEQIKLPDLHGFMDFIPWRKAQKCLNTHTDEYKKAQSLLNTLKNKKDVERCEGILNFDRLMAILEGKYLHMEKLVPSLITKLKNIPKATDDKSLANNISKILNVYEQLKGLDKYAINRFDLSVVEDLVQKFPFHEHKSYDRKRIKNIKTFKLQDELDPNAITVNQDDDMARHRQFFIRYITDIENAYNSTIARLSYNQDNNKRSSYPEKRIASHKHSSYMLEVKRTECLSCGSKEPHINSMGRQSRSLGQCPEFKKWNLQKKKSFIAGGKACWICLVPGHNKADCRVKNTCKSCGQKHHPLICDKKVEAHCVSCDNKHLGPVYLRYSEASIKDKRGTSKQEIATIIVFYDCGSTANFIDIHTARRLNYFHVCYEEVTVRTFDKIIEERMPVYELILHDKKGKEHKVRAYGVKNLSKDYDCQHTDETIAHYAKMFKVPKKNINNPIPKSNGKVDLILGESDVIFAPRIREIKDNVALSTSLLGKDYILSGKIYDPSWTQPPPKWKPINGIYSMGRTEPYFPFERNENWEKENYEIEEARVERNENRNKAVRLLNDADYQKQFKRSKLTNFRIEVSPSYWTGDQLGLNTPPRCITCLKASACKDCTYLSQPQTIKEQGEAKLIQDSMNFDKNLKAINVSYPYLKDPKVIFPPKKTNIAIAEKLAYNLKRGLERDKLLEEYTDAFMQMEERGAIKEISPKEMQLWESHGGAVNYASHHAVLKESKSTACRSVCNSSLAHAGTSLNAILPKGPKAISNLLHVLMRFRSKPYVIVADLSKAYNTIRTSEQDMHLRRLLWFRKEDLKKENPELRTFGMTSVAFGDTPSAYYLELSKMMVAEKLKEDGQSDLATEIIRSSYVDDFCIPLESESHIEESKAKMRDGFNRYGFKIKEFLIPKEGGERPKELLFGHLYDLLKDEVQLKFVVNFSSKKRSQRTGGNLTSRTDLKSLKMTKRKFMSLLASQYDPLGLASVFLSKFKIFLAKLFKNPKYDKWDQELEGEEEKQAIAMVKEMIFAQENPVVFQRANKPEGYHLKRLVVFTDASMNCLQVVLYAIFENERKEIYTSLISGKNKITNNSIPRNELNALVAAHRIVLNYLKAMDDDYLERLEDIVFLTDSMCVCDTLKRTYQTKDIFILNRVSNIYNDVRKMNFDCKYYWVSTKLNVADKGTRENCKYEYLQSKEWQEGPTILHNIESEAQFKFEIKADAIKDLKVYNIEVLYSVEVKDNDFNESLTYLLEKYTKFSKIVRIYSKVRWWKMLTESKEVLANKTETKESLKHKNFQETKLKILSLCKPTDESIQGVKRKYFVEENNEQNVTLISRPYTCDDKVLQHRMLLLQLNKISMTLLNEIHIHCSNVEREIAKMMDKGYYIIGARSYLKKLQQSCLSCRRIRKEAIKCKMGPAMSINASKSQPFTHCYSDIKGPIWTKLTRNVRKKMWILTLTDVFTRYTVFTLLLDMTANSVLKALKTIAYSVGGRMPVYLYTDFGTNYVPIKNITDEKKDHGITEKLKVSDLSNTLESSNIHLILSSAKAPWRQGSVEAMHKIFIMTLKRTNLVSKSYETDDWVHILAFVTYQVNLRPLSLKINENLSVLTPMKLIFGRTMSDQQNPENLMQSIESNRLYDRLNTLTKELNSWKRLYIDTYLNECKKANKWKVNSVTLKPNDIVLILDHENKATGFPSIGRVKEVISDRSYSIDYVKKDAIYDGNNKIVKSAVIGNFVRPAQGLCFICETSGSKDNTEIDLEPQTSSNFIEYNVRSRRIVKQVNDKEIDVIKNIN